MPALSLADVWLVIVYLAVTFLPGLLITLSAGLRRWTAVALAPLVGYGVTALVGPLSSVGLRWTPLTLLGGSVAMAAICLVLRVLVDRRRFLARAAVRAGTGVARDRRGDATIAGAVVLASGIGAAVVLIGIGRLDAIHQDWDAIFHANAIRFILDTGNTDPGALRAINNYEDPAFFYPNAYHAVAAVVGTLTGANVPELMNSQMLLVPGTTALGLAALLRGHGARVALAATTPVLLVAFTGFATDMLFRGPLLPFVTALALLPAFLLGLGDVLDRPRFAPGLVVALTAVGLLGLHPSIALTAAIFAVPMLLQRWAGRLRRVLVEAPVLLVIAAMSGLLGLRFALGALKVGGTANLVDWKANQTPGQAVGDLLMLNHERAAPQFWLAALLVVGLLTVARLRPLWWWLVGATVFGAGFVATSAYDLPWTETVTGPWWNDPWRFVAIAVLGLAVLAAHGAVVLAEAALGLARRQRLLGRPGLAGRVWLGAAMVAVLAVFGLASNGFYVPANAKRMALNFQDGPTLPATERVAMAALARMAGPGDRIMNDPLDGSPWMYSLYGLHPMYGHIIAPLQFGRAGPDQQELIYSFRCLDSDQSVRDLIAKYGIRYVFVNDTYVRKYFKRIPGLLNLSPVKSLQLVYSRDGTNIYRIQLVPLRTPPAGAPACGRRAAP